MHWLWERPELGGALIAGVAALAGAAVGGISPYAVNSHSEKRADERAAAAEAATVRGIARVLRAHYSSADIVVDTMARSGHFMPARPLAEELSYADQKRLAASVSGTTWRKVARADADLVSLVQRIGASAPYELRMERADARMLFHLRLHLRAAQEVLKPIAE